MESSSFSGIVWLALECTLISLEFEGFPHTWAEYHLLLHSPNLRWGNWCKKRLGNLDVMTQSLSHGGDWKDHEIKGSPRYVVRHPFKTERTNKINVNVTQSLVNSGLHPYPFMHHFLKDLFTCVSVYECVHKSAGHGLLIPMEVRTQWQVSSYIIMPFPLRQGLFDAQINVFSSRLEAVSSFTVGLGL